MSFPASTVTVPTLTAYQFSYLGQTFGAGANSLNTKEWDGFGIDQARTGDKPRARDWGEWVGQDEIGGKNLTIKFDLGEAGLTDAQFASSFQAICEATVPQGAVEQPFFFNLVPGLGTLVHMARPRRRSWKADIPFAFHLAENMTAQWHASDPRCYSTPTQVSSCTLSPISDAGFKFPFSFPLNFGGAESPGAVTINNAGWADCRPILTITGPADNPAVINASVSGSPQIAFNYNLPSGWKIVVDTDAKSALVYSSGTGSVGAPIGLASGSTWWSLQPGSNIVQLTASGPAGATPSLSVEWASAFLL